MEEKTPPASPTKSANQNIVTSSLEHTVCRPRFRSETSLTVDTGNTENTGSLSTEVIENTVKDTSTDTSKEVSIITSYVTSPKIETAHLIYSPRSRFRSETELQIDTDGTVETSINEQRNIVLESSQVVTELKSSKTESHDRDRCVKESDIVEDGNNNVELWNVKSKLEREASFELKDIDEAELGERKHGERHALERTTSLTMETEVKEGSPSRDDKNEEGEKVKIESDEEEKTTAQKRTRRISFGFRQVVGKGVGPVPGDLAPPPSSPTDTARIKEEAYANETGEELPHVIVDEFEHTKAKQRMRKTAMKAETFWIANKENKKESSSSSDESDKEERPKVVQAPPLQSAQGKTRRISRMEMVEIHNKKLTEDDEKEKVPVTKPKTRRISFGHKEVIGRSVAPPPEPTIPATPEDNEGDNVPYGNEEGEELPHIIVDELELTRAGARRSSVEVGAFEIVRSAERDDVEELQKSSDNDSDEEGEKVKIESDEEEEKEDPVVPKPRSRKISFGFKQVIGKGVGPVEAALPPQTETIVEPIKDEEEEAREAYANEKGEELPFVAVDEFELTKARERRKVSTIEPAFSIVRSTEIKEESLPSSPSSSSSSSSDDDDDESDIKEGSFDVRKLKIQSDARLERLKALNSEYSEPKPEVSKPKTRRISFGTRLVTGEKGERLLALNREYHDKPTEAKPKMRRISFGSRQVIGKSIAAPVEPIIPATPEETSNDPYKNEEGEELPHIIVDELELSKAKERRSSVDKDAFEIVLSEERDVEEHHLAPTSPSLSSSSSSSRTEVEEESITVHESVSLQATLPQRNVFDSQYGQLQPGPREERLVSVDTEYTDQDMEEYLNGEMIDASEHDGLSVHTTDDNWVLISNGDVPAANNDTNLQEVAQGIVDQAMTDAVIQLAETSGIGINGQINGHNEIERQAMTLETNTIPNGNMNATSHDENMQQVAQDIVDQAMTDAVIQLAESRGIHVSTQDNDDTSEEESGEHEYLELVSSPLNQDDQVSSVASQVVDSAVERAVREYRIRERADGDGIETSTSRQTQQAALPMFSLDKQKNDGESVQEGVELTIRGAGVKQRRSRSSDTCYEKLNVETREDSDSDEFTPLKFTEEEERQRSQDRVEILARKKPPPVRKVSGAYTTHIEQMPNLESERMVAQQESTSEYARETQSEPEKDYDLLLHQNISVSPDQRDYGALQKSRQSSSSSDNEKDETPPRQKRRSHDSTESPKSAASETPTEDAKVTKAKDKTERKKKHKPKGTKQSQSSSNEPDYEADESSAPEPEVHEEIIGVETRTTHSAPRITSPVNITPGQGEIDVTLTSTMANGMTEQVTLTEEDKLRAVASVIVHQAIQGAVEVVQNDDFNNDFDDEDEEEDDYEDETDEEEEEESKESMSAFRKASLIVTNAVKTIRGLSRSNSQISRSSSQQDEEDKKDKEQNSVAGDDLQSSVLGFLSRKSRDDDDEEQEHKEEHKKNTEEQEIIKEDSSKSSVPSFLSKQFSAIKEAVSISDDESDENQDHKDRNKAPDEEEDDLKASVSAFFSRGLSAIKKQISNEPDETDEYSEKKKDEHMFVLNEEAPQEIKDAASVIVKTATDDALEAYKTEQIQSQDETRPRAPSLVKLDMEELQDSSNEVKLRNGDAQLDVADPKLMQSATLKAVPSDFSMALDTELGAAKATDSECCFKNLVCVFFSVTALQKRTSLGYTSMLVA